MKEHKNTKNKQIIINKAVRNKKKLKNQIH